MLYGGSRLPPQFPKEVAQALGRCALGVQRPDPPKKKRWRKLFLGGSPPQDLRPAVTPDVYPPRWTTSPTVPLYM